jgi:Carbohydrate binding domain
VEDNTTHGAKPQEAPATVPAAPERSAAEPGEATAGLPVPPAPAPLPRPAGRHEAQRSRATTLAVVAVPVAVIVVAALLINWLIGSARQAPETVDATPTLGDGQAATTANAGPTSRPARAFGNLVANWSFEQDLSGWQVLGEADASREPQGRTSGSSASVRARGPEPGQVGLALPEVVSTVKRGQRYVASAWVRSSASGQPVTLRVVGGGTEVSKKTAATLAGLEWRRIIVDHTVAGAGALGLEIVADGVPAGDAVLVDEVVVREG